MFEFRSLMAWGKKLPLSLSVFAIMLRKRLPDGSKTKRWLPGWFVSLMISSASAFAAFEVDVLIWGITIPHWDALSQYTFYVPWIESFQDCWWDPEFPQLLQMVQSLPGFLDLCLNVCGPCQVLGAVYTNALEAAHPLHRGPTDHKRSLGPLLSLPEVHDQLFSFAHIQRETVVLAPWWKVSTSSKYAVLSLLEMGPRTTVLWLNVLFYSVLFTMQSSVEPNFWFIYPSFAKFSDIPCYTVKFIYMAVFCNPVCFPHHINHNSLYAVLHKQSLVPTSLKSIA